MAQRIHVTVEDDIDGGEAEGTILFGLDGTDYEIDLSTKNMEKLNKAMGPFVKAARQLKSSGKHRTSRGKSRGNAADNPHIRAWARTAGMEVSERGRIPGATVAAWEAAGSPKF